MYRSSCIDKLWRHLHVTISVQVSMRWSCPFGVIKGCDDFKLHYRRFHGRQLKVCLFGAKNVSNHGKKLNVFFTNLQAISGLLGLLMYEGDSFWDFFLKMTEFLISKLNFRDVKHTSSKPSGTHLLTALCFPKTKDETKNYKKIPLFEVSQLHHLSFFSNFRGVSADETLILNNIWVVDGCNPPPKG